MKKIPLYFPPINKLGNSAFRNLCLDSGAEIVFTEMIRIDKILENDDYNIKKAIVPESQKSKTYVQVIAENINLIEKGVGKIVEFFPQVKEINYNMGCPQSSLCKNECGGGIVGNYDLVEKVAKLLKSACDKYKINASIKIRLGISRDNITIYENVKRIKNIGINTVYIHGRCLKDTYNKPATWEEIGKVKQMFPEMYIIANGDVKNSDSLFKIITITNCDGVLIGRAALENPYIFKELLSNDFLGRDDSGVDLKSRFFMIKQLIKYALKQNVSLSHVKSNIAYLTKGVVNGAEFRREINDIIELDKLDKFCENYCS